MACFGTRTTFVKIRLFSYTCLYCYFKTCKKVCANTVASKILLAQFTIELFLLDMDLETTKTHVKVWKEVMVFSNLEAGHLSFLDV